MAGIAGCLAFGVIGCGDSGSAQAPAPKVKGGDEPDPAKSRDKVAKAQGLKNASPDLPGSGVKVKGDD